MVNDQILLPDGRETVARVIADAFRKARIVRHELQVGPVKAGQLRELVERQHSVDQEHVLVADRKRVRDEAPKLGWHRRLDLQADRRPAPPPLERGLEQTHQILGLFLDLDLGIPDDAKRALPLYGITGEQAADEQAGRLLDRDDPCG